LADDDFKKPELIISDPQPFVRYQKRDRFNPDPFHTGDVDVPLPPGDWTQEMDDDLTQDEIADVTKEMRRADALDRALAKYDTSSLESKPGKSDNWIEAVGGDLPSFVRAVAHALMREGKPKSQAIGMAIGQMKNWASGQGNVTAKTRAKAAAAVAEWEALRAKAAAK
jgi:hypothetical protein